MRQASSFFVAIIALLGFAVLLPACGGEKKDELERVAVSGSVIDSRDVLVPGARVQVVGKRFSTTTDALGRFVLDVPVGDRRLAITRDGHTHSEPQVAVASGTPVDLGVLTPAATFYMWFADGDGDDHGVAPPVTATVADVAPAGHATTDDDCDDGVDSTYPGAPELCNTTDDDCDGQVDEGLPTQTYYRDADADGYGTPSETVDSCGPVSGYVLDANDCDDAVGSTYPGAPELCNTIDDDCDGQVDEGLPTQTYYRDADADGYGTPSETVDSCGPVSGYVLDANDCDDTEARLNPDTLWYPDVDGDLYPGESDPVAACEAPSPDRIADYLVTEFDCDDGEENVNPGVDEIPGNGIDDDCDPMTSDTDQTGPLAGTFATHAIELTLDTSTYQQPTILARGSQRYDGDGRLLARKLGTTDNDFTWYEYDESFLGPDRLQLEPSGVITSHEDLSLEGFVGVGEQVVVLASELGDEGLLLRLLIREGEALDIDDLSGGWMVHDLDPEGGGWRRGAMLIDADGVVDATFEFAGIDNFVLDESGAAVIAPMGDVALFLGTNNIPLSMSADGELLAGTYTERENFFNDRMMLAVRADPLGYQQAELSGQWSFTAIGIDSSVGFYRTLGRGTFEVDAAGNTEVLFQRWHDTVVDLPEGQYVRPIWRKPDAALAPGQLSLAAVGVVSHDAMPSFTATLSRDRNLLVATYLTPTDESPVLLFAQRRRSAPTALVSADETRRVEAAIDPLVGGTLETTGADGTHYRLDVPVGTLDRFAFTDRTLALTPLVSSAGTLPNGPVLGAVRLEPEGLRFFTPATLTITPPAAPGTGPLLGYRGGAGGTDHFAFEAAYEQGSSVVLALEHLSTHYACSGDCDSQSDPGACYSDEVDDAAQDSSDPANDPEVAYRSNQWEENILLSLYGDTTVGEFVQSLQSDAMSLDEFVQFLQDLLKHMQNLQLLGAPSICSRPDVAAQYQAALQQTGEQVLSDLDAACLQEVDVCQKLFLIREFLRLRQIAQSVAGADGCLQVPLPDPAEFCGGAFFSTPADMDLAPNPAAVLVDEFVSIGTDVKNAEGTSLSGWDTRWDEAAGSELILEVSGGLVKGLEPGAGTVIASVQNACVEVTADVFVSPNAEGRWTVETTNRVIGSSREECQDLAGDLGDYVVDFRIGEPDPFEDGGLQVSWSDPFGGNVLGGHLWGPVLRVSGIRTLATPLGVFDVNTRCEVMPLGETSGTGTCDWSWLDIYGGCNGQDEIYIEYLGPIP